MALLEALGYPYTPEVRYLLTDEVVPIFSAVPRDGDEYLWAVETTFADPDTSPLEQTILAEQSQGEQDASSRPVDSRATQIKGNPKSRLGRPDRRDLPPGRAAALADPVRRARRST